MSKLKIGLLLDSERIDAYVLDLLDWAGRQDNLEITAALVCRPARAGGRNLLRALDDFASNLLLRLVIAAEGLVLRLFKPHRAHLSAFSLRDAAPGIHVTALQPSGRGADAGFPQAELDRIGALRLDLLVGAGSKAAAWQLAGAARLGTVMLDYRGKRAGAQAPPGFWEAYSKAPKTAFEIAQPGPHGTPGRILVSGSFPTKFLFLLNQAHLYSQANAQLKGLLKTVAATRCLPPPQSARPYSGRYRGQPGLRHSAAYLVKMASRLGAKAFLRLFNIREKWGISCIYANWKDAALWDSTRIAAPRGHFWADPFLCSHDGKTYCFVEDYVYKTSRGHISVLEITGHGARLLGDCIKEDFHMSFPFLFRYKGELYMCPESSQARQVRQYRCKSFPLEWELHSVAMDGISAADTMFFEHAGKWWMLTNIDRSGLNDHCFELCLFHAASPFDQDWTPHPQNPLRIDPDGGRNAGLILEDGRIFRAAQRQGFDQYGKGLMLYEVLELTEDRYTERLVSEIDCNFRRGLLGSHHVSTTGKVTVFDHVGRSFFP
jgi:hypothetical protein